MHIYKFQDLFYGDMIAHQAKRFLVDSSECSIKHFIKVNGDLGLQEVHRIAIIMLYMDVYEKFFIANLNGPIIERVK